MRWLHSTLDANVRLEEEILVVWRGDELVNAGTWMCIAITPPVTLLVRRDVEASVVTLGDNHRCEFEVLGRELQRLASVSISAMNGPEFDFFDLEIVAAADTVAIVDNFCGRLGWVKLIPVEKALINHVFQGINNLENFSSCLPEYRFYLPRDQRLGRLSPG